VQYACTRCGTVSDQRLCPQHRPTFKQRRGISSGRKAHELNQAALRRDGYRCTWVENGRRCTETTNLEVDHRVSIANGGTWALSNLQTLCHDHHVEKGQGDG
jgi:5-methylcytosine-specific restriction endonuclease McrA